jgi:hypothetical protein
MPNLLDGTRLPLLLADFAAGNYLNVTRMSVGTDIVALPIGDAGVIWLDAPGDVTLRGIAGGGEGRSLWLWAPGRVITLSHEDTTARPEHRIMTSWGVSVRVLKTFLVYDGNLGRWLTAFYEPADRVVENHVEASNNVIITAGAGEVYANLLWGAEITVPAGNIATLFASGSARLFSGAPAALHIAFHSGGTAYRSINIYSDTNSVISVSHVRAFQGPTTVTPELVGVTAPGGPNANFERRSLSTLVIFKY